MKFSIIVPVYNVEKYIRECIDSILSQDYGDYEILLIDDGSKDNSSAICDEYGQKDNRIKVFHKENGGLSDARNYGLDRVTGDYVMFIDSDDWIAEGCLSAFAKAIGDAHPDVLETRLTESFEDETVYKDENMEAYLQEGFTGERAFDWMIKHSENTWPAPKKILSASFIQKHQIRFLKGRLHEDMDWTARVCYVAETFAACSKPWYFHRMQRAGSITNSIKAKNITDVIEMAAIHYDYVKEHKTEQTKMVLDRVMVSVYTKINETRKCTEEDKLKVAACMKENRRVFSVAPTLKYKLFVLLMKVVGIRNALKILEKI